MKKALTVIAVSALIIVVAVIVFFAGISALGIIRPTGYLVKESTAVRALDTQGFRQIKVLKRNCSFVGVRGGAESDKVRFTVQAVNPAGKTVTIYVFAGWPFKGATVRTP